MSSTETSLTDIEKWKRCGDAYKERFLHQLTIAESLLENGRKKEVEDVKRTVCGLEDNFNNSVCPPGLHQHFHRAELFEKYHRTIVDFNQNLKAVAERNTSEIHMARLALCVTTGIL